MTKKRNADGTLIAPLTIMKGRVANLVVVRESDVSDKLLMLGMVDKTLYGCHGMPGVEMVKTFGLEPFSNPDKFGAQYKKTPTHKMVLFAVEGTLFLYAMGSAAKEETDTAGNDFIEFLMEILKQYRPETMTLANITRLMRSTRRVGELQSLLSEIGCVLRLEGGTLINVREPSGSMQFMMMSMFAAFERDHIVLRMLAGLVASANRGGVHFREEHLPLGYILENDRVRPDPTRKKDVETFLTILGLDLTSRQKATSMSAGGVRMNRSFGPNKTNDPADARDMKGFIKGIEQWLDLYATGIHTVKRENPFVGLDRIGVAPVIRTSDSDPGYIELKFDWGIPEGGWVSEEVIARIRQASGSRSRKGNGGAGHKIRKPLLGLVAWVDDANYEWVLDSHTGPEYRLRKRLFKQDGLKGWAEASIDGEIVARMKTEVLHTSIADEITKAITSGVAIETLQGQYIGQFAQSSFVELDNSLSMNALINEEKFFRMKANRARKLVLDMAEDNDASPWIKDAIEFERKADEQKGKIDSLANSVKAIEILNKKIPTDFTACAGALSVLRRVKMSTSKDVSEALGQILRDITLQLTPTGKIAWKLYVLLPTSEGAVRLGPITGEIDPVQRKIFATRSPLKTSLQIAQMLEIFSQGGTVKEALVQIPEWNATSLRVHTGPALRERGLPKKVLSTLLNAKVPELRMAVIGGLLARPNMSRQEIPDVARELNLPGCSIEWIEHILTFYLFPKRTHFPRTWITGVGFRQELLNHLVKAGGEMSLKDVGSAMGGNMERPQISHNLLKPPAGGGDVEFLSIVEPGLFYEKVRSRVSGESTIKLVKCPHCEGFASLLMITPEVTRQLLCPSCRRMPTISSPVFPEIYFQITPPLTSARKNDWDTSEISISAKEYLNTLPEDVRASIVIKCRSCEREMSKNGRDFQSCRYCRKGETLKKKV